jgi:hypothetical protein
MKIKNKNLKSKINYCTFCNKQIPFIGYNRLYKYCSKTCEGAHRSKESRLNAKKLFENGKLKHRKRIYEILCERDGNKCSVCGITEWNNKPIRFWVDHIDGDPSNNKPNNFRLICLNCDSQTDTFMSKNIGRGRASQQLEGFKSRKI